jgi:hypothetical protein
MYKLDTPLEKIKFVREASAVSRCHTFPHIGEYPVGLHTFNMLAMLRLLHPSAPIVLIWAILEHDVPERLTGDIPSPTKWFQIVDSGHLSKAEAAINTGIFGVSAEHTLDLENMKWLKSLDLLELFMWCKDQEMLGNKNVHTMMDRIHKYIKSNPHLFVKEVLDIYYVCLNDKWVMCPDLGESQ